MEKRYLYFNGHLGLPDKQIMYTLGMKTLKTVLYTSNTKTNNQYLEFFLNIELNKSKLAFLNAELN